MRQILKWILIVFSRWQDQIEPLRKPVVELAVNTVIVGVFTVVNCADIADVIETEARGRRAALEINLGIVLDRLGVACLKGQPERQVERPVIPLLGSARREALQLVTGKDIRRCAANRDLLWCHRNGT